MEGGKSEGSERLFLLHPRDTPYQISMHTFETETRKTDLSHLVPVLVACGVQHVFFARHISG